MGKASRFVIASHVAVLCLATTSFLRAEPLSDGGRGRLLLSAEQAMKDGRFAEAREAFLDLWEATGERDAACNVGRLSFRIGDMVRAVEFLRRCAATAREGDRDAKDVQIELAQARRQVTELRVPAPAGAEVTIDGTSRGKAPLVAYVAPGQHTVGISGAGGRKAETTVHAGAGETRVVDLHLKEPSGADGRIIVAGGAVSAVLLGVGTALLVAAHQEEQDAKEQVASENRCFVAGGPRCEGLTDAYGSAGAMRLWSTVAFIAGGATAAGTLTYALFPHTDSARRVVGAGLVVQGAW